MENDSKIMTTLHPALLGGIHCLHPDGTGTDTFIDLYPGFLRFDAAGILYASTGDNVYRLQGTTQTPLITAINTVPVAGTLRLDIRINNRQTRNAVFAYNARDELTGVTRDNQPAEGYGYDAVGNRLTDTRATDYVYDSQNQLLQGGSARYTYDANGHRLTQADTRGVTRYTYNGENRLTRIDFPNGGFAEYAYDPFGRRIQKKVTDSQGNITSRRYVYDGVNLLFELDGQNNVVTEFTPGPGIDAPPSNPTPILAGSRHKVRNRGAGIEKYPRQKLYMHYGLYKVPTSTGWKTAHALV